MALKRSGISMTDEEIRSYLSHQKLLVLVSNGLQGFPHPLPMNYAFEDDCFLMTTFRKSQKVKNLERDSHCALLVDAGDVEYSQIKSVIAYANAEIIDSVEQTREVMTLAARRTAQGNFSAEEVAANIERHSPKRVVLRCKPHHFISWDHSKLAGQY